MEVTLLSIRDHCIPKFIGYLDHSDFDQFLSGSQRTFNSGVNVVKATRNFEKKHGI